MDKLFLASAAVVLGADQISKYFVGARLRIGENIPIIPGFFSLVSVRNRGAAFGFLNRHDIDWQIWLFLGATILAGVILCFMIRKSGGDRLLSVAAGCIMGGAIGNMIDRFRFGAVVDFLDVYWEKWHWPAFNVADMAICLGAALILFDVWKKPRATE